MPYGRRSSRSNRRPFRSRYPRVTKRTGRKIVKAYLRKKSRTGNTAVFKLKYNLELNVSDLQAGVFGSLTNPTAVVNGTGTVNDWSGVTGLYDSYKVCAVKLSFIPYNAVNVTDPATPGSSYGYWPLYHAIDYDNSGVTGPLPTDLDEYENCKMYNTYKPWKRYMRVPKYSTNSPGGLPTVILAKGNYFDVQQPPIYGVWYLRMQDGPATELVVAGKLRVTMFIACKNRM